MHRQNPKDSSSYHAKVWLTQRSSPKEVCSHYSQVLHCYANLLNRDFTANRPNNKWVTDIFDIKTGQSFLYLSIIRDLYDNSSVTYKISARQTAALVLDTIRCAADKKVVAAELQLHSDQWFQYTSHTYFNLTKEYGITPPMSRRGNPYDNTLAEHFFSILKTECLHRQKIHTITQAQI